MLYAFDCDEQKKQNKKGEVIHHEEQVYELTHLCTNMFSIKLGVNNIVDAYYKKPYKLSLFKEAFKDQILVNGFGFNGGYPISGIQEHFTSHIDSLIKNDILSPQNSIFMADMLCEVFRGELVLSACSFAPVEHAPVKTVKFGEQRPDKKIDNYEDYLLFDRMVRASRFIQNTSLLSKVVWAATDLYQEAVYNYADDKALPTFTEGNKKVQRLSLTTKADSKAKATRYRWHFADAENLATVGMHALHGVRRFYNDNAVVNHIERFNKEYFPLLNHELNNNFQYKP